MGVLVGVIGAAVYVGPAVGVLEGIGVRVGVRVIVAVRVIVGVGVGFKVYDPFTLQVPQPGKSNTSCAVNVP